MDFLLKKYLPRIEFDSYEDFKENFKINVPEDFNFGFDVVDAWAKEEPEKMALVWCNDHNEEKKFTFTDLSKLSNKAANYFKSLGIKKGTVVMLILRRRWEYWICATALHKIGAILIPGSLQLTTKDLVFRGNAAQIHTIVCIDDDFVVEQVNGAFDKVESLKNRLVVGGGKRENWISFNEEMEKYSDEFPRPTGEEATKWNDTMLVYFTSGTTGMPKSVMHNFAHPFGHIITAKYWQQVQENKLHMSVSDSGWAKFGWGKIYGQWLSGAVIFAYDMDKFIPKNLLQKMQDYKLTTFCAPPTMYRFMLQEDVASYDLSSIQNFATAGEPLNAEVFNKWKKVTNGGIIREGFGQTEGNVLLATFPWVEPKPGALGKPSPLYDIKLLKENGEIAGPNEEGAIIVDNIDKFYPAGLFVGYYKNPEMTKEVLGGRYYNLHDMAYADEEGYYHFVGRNDDVIKCSGYRIGPFEVESAVLEHPACVECAITAAPDPIRGQVVKATIVLAKGYEPSPELVKEIQNHVKHTTAPYKYPRIVEFVDELPKTLGGKIKRAEIRKDNYSK
ncbi:MAG: AMP-binding protein [Oscillospiraceae bacterium]|nr:AMP-binding protein [Oscillospiraceae bacterium]